MDFPPFIRQSARGSTEIKTIEMHTTGEPTRIVYAGYPHLKGTLLEQRAQAQSHHDHIRRALIYEPRGHREMYAAVLRSNTEFVESGEAHLGVLFLTNEGYSTMCGHATLAIARLLVDSAGCGSESDDLSSLTCQTGLKADWERREVDVRLHVPCGIVNVTVPIIQTPTHGESGNKGSHWKTDTNRPISYLSVPSYATGVDVTVHIPSNLRWPELGEKESVQVDIAYGGAFYIITSPSTLGFSPSLFKPDLVGLSIATRRLKDAFNSSPQLRTSYLQPSSHPDLEFLYGTILTDPHLGVPEADTVGAETSLCFFSNAQVDRSPTGSGVQAKVALACAKQQRKLGDRWTYHSLVSNQHSYTDSHSTDATPKESGRSNHPEQSIHANNVGESQRGEGAFVGEAVREVDLDGTRAVTVTVSGWARYTGTSCFVVEDGDGIGGGFWFDGMGVER